MMTLELGDIFIENEQNSAEWSSIITSSRFGESTTNSCVFFPAFASIDKRGFLRQKKVPIDGFSTASIKAIEY